VADVRFCTRCGRAAAPENAFCGKCGAPLQPVDIRPASIPLTAPPHRIAEGSVPKRSLPWAKLLAALAVIATLVGLGYYQFGRGASRPSPATTGTFSPTGSMTTPRDGQTATLLPSGRVLIAGGSGFVSTETNGITNTETEVLASAELYDPTTRIFSPTGSMVTARHRHTATRLADGRVLVAGGMSGFDSPTVASAELYDPKTGKFTATGSMASARAGHTATLLSDGRVLIAGGYDSGSGPLAGLPAELYDPKTGQFTATGSMASPRSFHAATLLSDGRVLIAGGDDAQLRMIGPAELYDPKTGQFAATGSMTAARYLHTATGLADGRVLIAGGTDGSKPLASAEIYDPATGSFTVTASMATARPGCTATLLTDGRVLMTGGSIATRFAGSPFSSAEVYDPKAGQFTATGSMTSARAGHTATLLSDGSVLVAGGSGGFDASAELYLP